MRMHVVVTILALAVGLVATELQAQTGVVRGKIIDEDGRGVSKAKLTLESRDGTANHYEAETNDKGEYRLIVSPGRYLITA